MKENENSKFDNIKGNVSKSSQENSPRINCSHDEVFKKKLEKAFGGIVPLGHYIKQAHLSIERYFDKNAIKLGLSGNQMRVFGYICMAAKDKTIYQKDIEQVFNIRRSSATAILQSLEKSQMIVREQEISDSRLKKIMPTKSGLKLLADSFETIKSAEKKLSDGFSDEEKSELIRLLKKATDNLKN